MQEEDEKGMVAIGMTGYTAQAEGQIRLHPRDSVLHKATLRLAAPSRHFSMNTHPPHSLMYPAGHKPHGVLFLVSSVLILHMVLTA